MKLVACLIFALFFAVFPAAAQQTSKPDSAPKAASSAPTLTDAEKVEILKLQKQQSDLTANEASLQAQAQAQYQQLQQQKQAVDAMLSAKIADANKKLGAGWTLNADTLEAVKVPDAKQETEKK